jgi:hypothetical protein
MKDERQPRSVTKSHAALMTISDALLQDGNGAVHVIFTNWQLTQQRTVALRLRLWHLAP